MIGLAPVRKSDLRLSPGHEMADFLFVHIRKDPDTAQVFDAVELRSLEKPLPGRNLPGSDEAIDRRDDLDVLGDFAGPADLLDLPVAHSHTSQDIDLSLHDKGVQRGRVQAPLLSAQFLPLARPQPFHRSESIEIALFCVQKLGVGENGQNLALFHQSSH